MSKEKDLNLFISGFLKTLETKEGLRLNIEEVLRKDFPIFFGEEHSLHDLVEAIESNLDFLLSNQCLRIKSARVMVPMKDGYNGTGTLTGDGSGIKDGGSSIQYSEISEIDGHSIKIGRRKTYKLASLFQHPDIIADELEFWFQVVKRFHAVMRVIELPADYDDSQVLY